MTYIDYRRGSGRPFQPGQEPGNRATDFDHLQYIHSLPGAQPRYSSAVPRGIGYGSVAPGSLFETMRFLRLNPVPADGLTLAEATTTGPAAVLRSGPSERTPQAVNRSLPRPGGAPVGRRRPQGPGRVPGGRLGALWMLLRTLDGLVETPEPIQPPDLGSGLGSEPPRTSDGEAGEAVNPDERHLTRMPSERSFSDEPSPLATRRRPTGNLPTLGGQTSVGRKRSSMKVDAQNGGGNRGVTRTDDEDFCGARWAREKEQCWNTWQERRDNGFDGYPWDDFLEGCKERARQRFMACFQNGGRPPQPELSEWGPEEEERWLNEQR